MLKDLGAKPTSSFYAHYLKEKIEKAKVRAEQISKKYSKDIQKIGVKLNEKIRKSNKLLNKGFRKICAKTSLPSNCHNILKECKTAKDTIDCIKNKLKSYNYKISDDYLTKKSKILDDYITKKSKVNVKLKLKI